MAEMEKVTFMSINAFKAKIGVESVEILKNKKTGKLFMSAGEETYKVQQDIDSKKEMRILIPEEGGMEEACLVNVNGGAETQFSL